MAKAFKTSLKAPFLRRISWIDPEAQRPETYPFILPWLKDAAWELDFSEPVTILAGENGVGKSTLIEAIAALAGYDEAGGGKGYRPVDHSEAIDRSGAELAHHLRGSWLPKITQGWFFKAESFFSVARYLDASQSPTADFLSYSHGEGFLRFFQERCNRQGFFLFDEPESALSPDRQLDLLVQLARIQNTGTAQIIMATHSPILMAVPGATLLRMSHRGLAPARLQDLRHFEIYENFTRDPERFIRAELKERSQRAEG